MEDTPPPASVPGAPSLRARLGDMATPLGVVVLVTLLFFAWQWWDTRHQLDSLSQELAKRLRDSDAGSQGGFNRSTQHRLVGATLTARRELRLGSSSQVSFAACR